MSIIVFLIAILSYYLYYCRYSLLLYFYFLDEGGEDSQTLYCTVPRVQGRWMSSSRGRRMSSMNILRRCIAPYRVEINNCETNRKKATKKKNHWPPANKMQAKHIHTFFKY